MIKSTQLAIIQAFTAPWEITFEEMVVILNFHQKIDKNDNINHVFITSICKWYSNVQYTQLVFKIAIEVWRSKTILSFAINHDFNFFLIYWMEGSFAYHDLMMDLIHTWWLLSLLFIFWWKFKMTSISSNFISHGAVKVWIIANCIDFII